MSDRRPAILTRSSWYPIALQSGLSAFPILLTCPELFIVKPTGFRLRHMPTSSSSTSTSTHLSDAVPAGARIVFTAPLTEVIDHAGYFIQMAMASLPIWLEGILNKKYPMARRGVQRRRLGAIHAGGRPCGGGVTAPPLHRGRRRCLLSRRSRQFIGPNTRVVAVSTHNPLGVTFAAGVYTSIFGSSDSRSIPTIRASCSRRSRRIPSAQKFKVIVGGSGGWQIIQTDMLRRAGR